MDEYLVQAVDVGLNENYVGLFNAKVYVSKVNPSDELPKDEDSCGQFYSQQPYSYNTMPCISKLFIGSYVTLLKEEIGIISFHTIHVWGYLKNRIG